MEFNIIGQSFTLVTTIFLFFPLLINIITIDSVSSQVLLYPRKPPPSIYDQNRLLTNRHRCEVALHSCSRNMRCEMALRDYRSSCSHLLQNRTRKCTENCKLALISLNSLPEGGDYLNCDCGENEYCRKLRRLITPCQPKQYHHHPFPELRPIRGSKMKISSCALVEHRCREDETCTEALDYFMVNCQRLFSGIECSKTCNISLHLLYRQKSAINLANCVCTNEPGFNETSCKRRKSNVKRLCYGGHGHGSNGSIGSVYQCDSIPFILMVTILWTILPSSLNFDR